MLVVLPEETPPPRPAGVGRVAVLALEPPQVPDLSRGVEIAGLVSVLLEAGLADIAEVCPRVGQAPPVPGLSDVPIGGAEEWTGRVTLAGEARALRLGLDLCRAEEPCRNKDVPFFRETPWTATAELLRWAELVLARRAPEGASSAWSVAMSPDPYAVLMCGRAAATLYGMLPPPEPELVGDRRKDPVARATYIDPGMAHAWWIAGRRSLAAGDLVAAEEAFSRATVAWPHEPVFLAASATSVGQSGRAEAALLAWRSLLEMTPGDMRFLLPGSRAEAAAEHPREALTMLEASPSKDDPAVLRARVELEVVLGPGPGHEDLLTQWKATAPDDPEPVRRLLSIRVRQRRWPEALDLAAELGRRGARAEADGLELALAASAGEPERAALAAEALGLGREAARLRARAIVERDPAAGAKLLRGDPDPMAAVVRGEARLSMHRPMSAVAEADIALAFDPWLPEGLSLRARALDALGLRWEAAQTRRLLARVEPQSVESSSPDVDGSGTGSGEGAADGSGTAETGRAPSVGGTGSAGGAASGVGSEGEGSGAAVASPAPGSGEGEAAGGGSAPALDGGSPSGSGAGGGAGPSTAPGSTADGVQVQPAGPASE